MSAIVAPLVLTFLGLSVGSLLADVFFRAA